MEQSVLDREVNTTRLFQYDQDLVYKAWTDPDHLKNWWGPAGFTNTFHVFDLKPRGTWSFMMHGPDGRNFQNDCEFIKIEEPSYVSWFHISKPQFTAVATFETINGQTKVNYKMIFETVEECNNLRAFIIEKNEENMDRLEQELSSML